MISANVRFKQALADRKLMVGSFIKTPHPIVVEVLGAGPLDFLVLDAEHAPFDRTTIDACLMAARAVDCPVVVRVPDPSWILGALDCGAAAVMVPHVVSRAQADALVRAIHYGPGGRGFTASPRAGGYGTRKLQEHLEQTAREVSLIAQIEDAEGVDNLAEIAATPGLDALFVGRADLTVSYGLSDLFSEKTTEISRRVLGVKGPATGVFCAPNEDISPWVAAGASFVVAGSEHNFLAAGGAALGRMRDSVAGGK
ncbi:HpcH/HpaI aldolase/citrate lyase family protein [Phaeovulum sp.]|uniref:HpcH/HpaI aldolase family protein n=1 Tax=Phaeovulum sp. TaxID=2934796 RepID=UPI0035615B18